MSIFWATVCKTVRPMLSDRCLSVQSCLSVTFVHCGQTVGRIKIKLGMQVGENWRLSTNNSLKSKLSTVESFVNLVWSQAYHTEHPPLFAGRLPWRGASRGFVMICIFMAMQKTVFIYPPSAPGNRRTVWLPVPVMSQCNATLFTSIFLDDTDDMHLCDTHKNSRYASSHKIEHYCVT